MANYLKLHSVGAVGNSPQIFTLQSTDTLNQITSPGYIQSMAANNGYSVGQGDLIIASYLNNTEGAIFSTTFSGAVCTLVPYAGTNIPSGTITGGASLGGDAIYAGVSGSNLTFKGLTAGSNITLTPSGSAITIAATGGGGSNYEYNGEYWIDMNGSDSNTGTSINEPWQTLAYAFSQGGYTYNFMSNFTDSSTLTLFIGNCFINGPSASFNGAYTLMTPLTFSVYSISNVHDNGNGCNIFANTVTNYVSTSGGDSYINCEFMAGTNSIAGNGTAFLNVGQLYGTLALTGTSYVFINPNVLVTGSITNDGTCYLNGVLGATDPKAGIRASFAYTQAFWVDLQEGNDSNLGTSIETPFLTMQHAIHASGSVPTIIYVVNGQYCTEALSTEDSGQVITVIAPSTSFTGTLTLQPADSLNIQCETQSGIWTANGTLVLKANSAGRIQSTNNNSINITADSLGATNFSGTPVNITCKTLTSLMTLTSSANVTLLAQDATSASYNNDGTCYLNGILNGVLPGLKGNQAIGGTLGFGDGTALNYTQTNASPSAANQVLLSSAAGPGATTSWGAAYTPFAYVRALWVSQSNGSDLNPGNTIEKPLQTLAAAIATCGNTPTVIYVIDAVTNYENITTLGDGQDVTIVAPGTSFSGTWIITAPDNVIVYCTDFGIGTTVTNNGYLTVNSARCYNVTSTSATTTINATAINGLTMSGGSAIVSCQESTGIALTSSATLFLSSTTTTTITNDGTCTVNGILGGVNPGWQGAQAIGGALTIGTALTTGSYYTFPVVDGTAGQVLKTDGAGNLTWQNP